jgi:phage baseplate assembly protein W
MATTRVLSREDGNLSTSTLITSRNKLFKDIDLTFTAKPNGEIYTKKDASSVKQAIKTLIQTNHYEKPFQPFFGGDIRSQLFELADETTENDIKDNIIYNIETYEPRAQLIDILVNYRPNQNSVEVTIEFQVVNSEEIVTFTTVLSRLR